MNDKHEKQYWLDKIKDLIKDFLYFAENDTTKDFEERLEKSATDIFDHIEIAIMKDMLQQLTDKISKKLYE